VELEVPAIEDSLYVDVDAKPHEIVGETVGPGCASSLLRRSRRSCLFWATTLLAAGLGAFCFVYM